MSAPYQVRLDAESARRLATQGCTVLLLDVPPGTLIGMDHQVFVVGPRFAGIKMIPPGTHFISYQAMPQPGHTTPAIGTFRDLASRQVVVQRWDPATEGLASLADEDEEERYVLGVRRFDFDQQLAPYNLGQYGQWQQLSNYITPNLLGRLNPEGGEICVAAEALGLGHQGRPPTAAEERLMQQLHKGRQQQQEQQEQPAGTGPDTPASTAGPAPPELVEGEGQPSSSGAAGGQASLGGRCCYTRIPGLVKTPGVSGAALSQMNIDKTGLLQQLLDEEYDGDQGLLLGELQYAFIAFLCGQSLEGFLQWKALVGLLLACDAALLSNTLQPLLLAALQALTVQLQVALGPSGGTPAGDAAAGATAGSGALGQPLVDELLPDSFLRRQFGELLEVVREGQQQYPQELMAQVNDLERVLRAGLGWDYRLALLGSGSEGEGDEEDEFGPVVVELPEDIRQQLLNL